MSPRHPSKRAQARQMVADGTEIADSHRYRMCGNGVASPVAEWVGRCILEVEQ